MLAADMVSFALRNEGKRGAWESGGGCAKSSTCVAEVSEGNGQEGTVGSGGIEELMVVMIGGLRGRKGGLSGK